MAKKKINVTIDEDLWLWLDQYHKNGMIDKSKIINLALRRTQAAVESHGFEEFFRCEEIKPKTNDLTPPTRDFV